MYRVWIMIANMANLMCQLFKINFAYGTGIINSKDDFLSTLICILFQNTLILTVLPEGIMLSRNAAQSIFSMETLRIFGISIDGSYSEEFYAGMAETSSSSKVFVFPLLSMLITKWVPKFCNKKMNKWIDITKIHGMPIEVTFQQYLTH